MTGRSFVLLALYAALPFVHFVADNPDYPVPLGRLALYFLICLAVLVGLTVLVARSHSRVERVATVVGLGFYGFGYLAVTVSEGLEILPVFGIGPGVFVVLALVLAAVLITRWNWVLSFFFVFALLMALGLAIQAVVAHTETRIGTPVAADLAFELTPPATTPDIYWFILDGYARGDVLEEEYGYAGQKPFLDDLQERGFSVSAEASSAYPMTHLSMASTLSLDYLEVEGGGLYVSSPYLEMIKGENVVVKTIEAWGYEYVHVDNGWGGARCPSNGRVCVRTGYGGEAEWEMLSVTPLADLLAEPMAAVESKRRDPLVALERLRNAGPRSPFFAQIHLINPHPPHFRGGVDCAQRVVPFDLTVPYGHTEYVEAIKCLNERLVKTVDEILAHDQNAIIILQGDHGPATFAIDVAPVDRWETDDVRVRFGVLSAMRLPSECEVPDAMTLVNTFRLVFDCIVDEDVPLLRDRAWLVNIHPGDHQEITPPIAVAD